MMQSPVRSVQNMMSSTTLSTTLCLVVTCWTLLSGQAQATSSNALTGAEVTSISPRVGSTAGGTRVTVIGIGFTGDLFTVGAGNENKGARMWLVNENQRYETDIHKDGCTQSQVTAYTRPLPAGTYKVVIAIDGKTMADEDICTRAKCKFTAQAHNTPSVDTISPAAGTIGTILQVSGKIMTSFFNSTELEKSNTNGIIAINRRAILGPDLCDYMNELGVPYGATLDGQNSNFRTGNFLCRVKAAAVGSYNLSFLVDDEFGKSEMNINSYWPTARNKIAGYQNYAVINRVSLQSGSTAGGQIVDVEGSLLDDEGWAPVQIFFGGEPATILDKNADRVRVSTPVDPDGDGHYRGNRGMMAYFYNSNALGFNAIEALDIADANAVRHLESTYMKWSLMDVGDRFRVVKLLTMVVAPQDGAYKLFMHGTCQAKLYLSTDHDPANKVAMLTLEQPQGQLKFNEPSQQSREVTLVQGNLYYMEAAVNCWEHSFIQISAFHFDTIFNGDMLGKAQDDLQKIEISSTQIPMTQPIDLRGYAADTAGSGIEVQTVTVSGGDESDWFRLGINNAFTDKIDKNSPSSVIQEQLNKLPTVHLNNEISVAYDADGNVYTLTMRGNRGDWDLVEILSSDALTVRVAQVSDGSGQPTWFQLSYPNSGGQPFVSKYMPVPPTVEQLAEGVSNLLSVQCPTEVSDPSDVFMHQSYEVINYDKAMYPESGRRVTDAEPFCGLGSNYNPNILYQYKRGTEHSVKVSLAFYRFACFAYKGNFEQRLKVGFLTINQAKKWIIAQVELLADGEWHYTCINIVEHIATNYGTADGPYRLTNLEIFKDDNYQPPTTYVDEFSIRRVAVSGTEIMPSRRAVPDVRAVKDLITVTETEDLLYTVEVTVENCVTPEPINVMHSSTTARATTTHTGAVSGTFTMTWEDPSGESHTMGPFDADETALSMKNTLHTNPAFGRMNVDRTGTCAGYAYHLRFANVPGRVNAITATGSLIGEDAAISTSRELEGGVMYAPMMGDIIATYHTTPQVVAIVNHIPSYCTDSLTGGCDYEWSAALTPSFTAISPDTGPAGVELTLTVTGADTSNIANNVVTFGDTNGECSVTSVPSDTTVVCTLAHAPLGEHEVAFRVAGKGRAVVSGGPFTLTVLGGITSTDPADGPLGGGNILTIVGSGFDTVTTSVTVDGNDCEEYDVDSWLPTTIYCVIPPASAGGAVDIVVAVGGGTVTSAGSFTYDDGSASPIITAVSASTGSAAGGELLTITGERFGTVKLTSRPMFIGSQEVEVKVSQTDTEVVLEMPPLGNGIHDILLYIEDVGYASKADGSFFTIEIDFTLTSLTPDSGSFYGGTQIRFEGTGFGGDPEDFDITVGDAPCDVYLIESTAVECTIGDTATTYTVTNDGTDDQYGQGYQWDPVIMEIGVNDFVLWTWDAFGNVQFKVQQTPDQNTDPDGSGFDSGTAERTGTFRQRFTAAGDYHYWSDVVIANFVMRGVIRVVEQEKTLQDVTFKLNGVEPEQPVVPSRRRRELSSCPAPSVSDCDPLDDSGNMMTISMLPCLVGTVDSFGHDDGGTLRQQATASETLTIGTTNLGTSSTECVTVDMIPQGDGDSYQCTVSSINGDGDIECLMDTQNAMPAGDVFGVYVTLQPVGYLLTTAMTYTDRVFQLQSEITAISPTNLAVTGGAKITITGTAFKIGSTSVLIDGSACPIYNDGSDDAVTYTEVVCVTPPRISDYTGELQVVVDGVAAVCSVGGGCDVAITDANTPHATAINPITLNAPTTFTITGDNFGTDDTVVSATIGGIDCVISGGDVSDTQIECAIEGVPLGPAQPVHVFVGGVGNAISEAGDGTPVTVESTSAIEALDVTVGSEAGGTRLVITGNGFVDGSTSVSFDDVPCEIDSITGARTIACTTGPHVEGTFGLSVTVNSEVYTTSETFNYAAANTPTIANAGVSPSEGVAGSTIFITGTSFSDTDSDNEVLVGDTPCVVTDATTTAIECTLGANVAGETTVGVYVSPAGNAMPLDAGGLHAIGSPPTFTVLIVLTSITPVIGSHVGGLAITLTGDGLSDAATVTVCGEDCTNVQGSATELTCNVPPSVAGSGEVECADVQVCHGACTDPATFTYSDAYTPSITAVNPTRSGTGGNVLITISGTSFGTTAGDVSVSISDIPCTVEDVDDTTILCRTGAKRPSVRTNVIVMIAGKGAASAATEGATDFEYIDVWSSEFSWGESGIIPRDGDFVHLPPGQNIVIDCETAILKMLLIDGGTVSFDRTVDVTLHAENILIINGGVLEVGTEEEPYLMHGEIIMHGRLRATELPVYGTKTIAVREGALEIHGRPTDITWTLLAETAEPGDSVIELQIPPPWRVGDKLIIATTGGHMSQHQTEKVEILSISETTITLTEPLEYQHLGLTEHFDGCGASLEVRAEVGLLTHNIVISGVGDVAWEVEIPACEDGFDPGEFATQTCFQGRFGAEMGSDEFGACLMAHNPEFNSQLANMRIENAEITYGGQAYRLGRYPIHFHFNGDMPNSYVRNCAIHRTFNRAINIHNSHNISIINNVVYDVKGGAIFLEDSIEQHNVMEYNLAVFVRASSSLLNDDLTPATFWITHPTNYVNHNHAAGGTHFGFWYRMLEHPEGPSHTESICPRNAVMGSFSNNTGHSLGWYMLWVFEVYHPKLGGCCDCNEHTKAVFRGMKAWNNFRGVEAAEFAGVQFHDVIAVNNYMAGIEMLEVMFNPPKFNINRGPAIVNSVVVSHFDYDGHPRPTRRGLVLPFGHGLLIDGICFDRFTNDFAIGLVKITCVCGNNCGAFKYRFFNVRWTARTTQYSFPEWPHMWQLEDGDGSLTGVPPVNGHYAHVVAMTPLYNRDRCEVQAKWGINQMIGQIMYRVPSAVCEPGVDFAEFAFNEIGPSVLEGQSIVVENRYGRPMEVKWHVKAANHVLSGWRMLVELPDPADFSGPNELLVTFPLAAAVTNITYDGKVFNMMADRHLIIRHNFARNQAWDTTRVRPNIDLTPDAGHPLSYPRDRFGAWHHDPETADFSYMVSDEESDADKEDLQKTCVLQMRGLSCYFPGCVVPDGSVQPPATEERPEGVVYWSDIATWGLSAYWYMESGATGTGLPTGNISQITVPEGVWLVLDTDEEDINVETLRIEGTLEVADTPGNNYVIDTTYIFVGGTFVIGWEDTPLEEASVTITLHGGISTPDFPIEQAITMGAKVIGVFGQLDIHGAPRTRWAKLQRTARAGDTSIQMADNVDWVMGDEIVIAPTSFHMREGETRTISGVRGRNIDFNRPLEYTHTVSRENLEGQSYEINTEVGLLTSNIKIRGVYEESEPNDYGGRVIVGTRTTTEDGEMITVSGMARVTHGEFKYMGQKGFTDAWDPRYAIAFVSIGDATADHKTQYGVEERDMDFGDYTVSEDEIIPEGSAAGQDNIVESLRSSYVISSAFHMNYATAIGVYDTDGATIRNNVVYCSVGPGIHMQGSDHVVVHNLVIESLAYGLYKQVVKDKIYHAAIDIVLSERTVLMDNVVAGSEKMAYKTKGDRCPSSRFYREKRYRTRNNVGRSVLHGVMSLQEECFMVDKCSIWQGFSIIRARSQGIYINTRCSIILNDIQLIDNTLGSVTFVSQPSAVYHQFQRKFIHIKNSLYVGQSSSFNCTHDLFRSGDAVQEIASTSSPFYNGGRFSYNGRPYGSGKVGIVWPTFISKNIGTPVKPFRFTKTFPAFYGETFISDVVFAHYGSACFGQILHMVSTHEQSPDAFHPIYSWNIKKVDVNRDAFVYIGNPKVGFVSAGACGDMECDGHKKALWEDRDGSVIGYPGFFLPRTDARWDGDPRYGIGDYRIPRAMQVDLTGERLPMSRVYGHTGLHIPEGNREYIRAYPGYIVGDSMKYRVAILENLDEDYSARDLAPIAIRSHADGMFIDLTNGPRSIGICAGYSCNFRLGNYFSIMALHETYDWYLTGTPPHKMRFHMMLPSDEPDDYLKICLYMDGNMRPDIYVGRRYKKAINAERDENGKIDYVLPPRNDRTLFQDTFDRTTECGANYMNTETDMLCFVQCNDPTSIRTTPVVLLRLGMPSISEEDFFGENVVSNLAILLGISPSQLRVVEAVPDSSRRKRRDLRHLRRKRAVDVTVYILEIGDNPAATAEDPDNSDFIMEPDEDDTQTNGTTVNGDVPTMSAETPSVEGSTVLSERTLTIISARLTEGLEDGSLATDLNVEIVLYDVATAPPTPGGAAWDDLIAQRESLVLPTLDPSLVPDNDYRPPNIPGYEYGYGPGHRVQIEPLPHPARIEIVQPPVAVCEGLPFNVQPTLDIVTMDGMTEPLTHGWVISAELITEGSTNPAAELLGTTSAPTRNGRVTFNNLGVTNTGRNFKIRFYVSWPEDMDYSRILSNLYVPSRVYHAKLDLSEVVVHQQFDLTVTIMDRNNLIATNMAWQGHNYEVILRSLSSDVFINGTDSAPVIIGNSQAEFTGLSINKVGLHAIEVYIQSTPDDYSNRAQVLLQVVDNQHVSPVIEATHLVQIKFDADYDLIFQKEMEFAVELYEALELPMSVNARDFIFAEGSIVATFTLSGANNTLTSVIDDISKFVKNGKEVVFEGHSMSAMDYLYVNGLDYEAVKNEHKDDDDKKVPLIVLIIVPIICVIIVVLILIVVICLLKKKKKEERVNSTEWHNKAYETYGDDEKPPAYTSDMFAARGDSPTGSCTKVPLTRPGTADTCSKRRLSAAKPEPRSVSPAARSDAHLPSDGFSDERPVSRTSRTTSVMGDVEARRTSVVVPSIG